MSALRPRLCVLEKDADGYGFHLRGDKSKLGQFVRLVEQDTPAAASGLRAGDRLVFVNGQSVEGFSHQEVVAMIRAVSGALELIVVDAETMELLEKHKLKCRREFVTEGIPIHQGDGDSLSNGSSRNGDASSDRVSVSSISKDDSCLRPRLCHIKREANEYGFNLHSFKTTPGQYIQSVDEGSPAQRAGLRPKDRIIQVNGVSVIGMQHSQVVEAIRAGGDETSLLVVDVETAEFFKRCNVEPTEEHLTGPLPRPVTDHAAHNEEHDEVPHVNPKHSVGSVSSSSSSNSSTNAQQSAGDSLALSVSLAQARERAHQKRGAKKAPSMDWSKRNELFSNL
ncbi:Na(+)/H(+) exchange regulatory cofactor NHE-RF1-like isoform 1-T1 [Synchiropus picturatus]